MLIGEYTHTIDSKNRLSLPSKFKKEMGKTVVVTRGLDKCLSIYTKSGWQKISEKLSSLSISKAEERAFNRFMLSGATEVSVDSMGRILIPEYLKDFGSLDKKVVWTGMGEKAELWDEKKWAKYISATNKDPESIAESLDGLI